MTSQSFFLIPQRTSCPIGIDCCKQNPCLHGAACEPPTDAGDPMIRFRCLCREGYGGKRCQYRISCSGYLDTVISRTNGIYTIVNPNTREPFQVRDVRPYYKSSLTLNEWKFNLSFSRVSLLFLNSWRVSVVPYYVTTHPPAVQNSIDTQEKLRLSELLEYGKSKCADKRGTKLHWTGHYLYLGLIPKRSEKQSKFFIYPTSTLVKIMFTQPICTVLHNN